MENSSLNTGYPIVLSLDKQEKKKYKKAGLGSHENKKVKIDKKKIKKNKNKENKEKSSGETKSESKK